MSIDCQHPLLQPLSNFLHQIFLDKGLRNSDLGKAQPLIVAVNCMLPVIPPLFSENSPADAVSLHTSTKFTPQNPTQELVDLIVTCPTEHDALVLRGLQAVDLPSGHSIVIPDTSKALQASDPNSDLCRYLISISQQINFKYMLHDILIKFMMTIYLHPISTF